MRARRCGAHSPSLDAPARPSRRDYGPGPLVLCAGRVNDAADHRRRPASLRVEDDLVRAHRARATARRALHLRRRGRVALVDLAGHPAHPARGAHPGALHADRTGPAPPAARRAGAGVVRGAGARLLSSAPGRASRSLDEFGLDAAVLFPNYGLLWEQRLASDRVAQRANARAYNRFVADVCGEGDGRLFGVAHVLLHDPAWAVEEIARVRAQGVRLAMIAPAPVDGKPLSHADFDPGVGGLQRPGRRAGVPRLGVREPAASRLARGRTGGRRAALRLHLLVPGAGRRARPT